MNASAPIYDVIIVGGGPAGLNAALILGRSCRRVALIDAGEPRNAAARELHGFLSRDGIGPRELLQQGRTDVQKYGVLLLDDRVVACENVSATNIHKTAFVVSCAAGKTATGRKLLFASGMTDKLPEFPGIRECYGATIHHCPYCDGWEHRGKGIVAYGASVHDAVGLGLSLRTWSQQVTVLTNGDPPSPEELGRLQASSISWRPERITRLLHAGDRLLGVELEASPSVTADALFFNCPQLPRCDLAKALGCNLDEQRHARTTDKQKTNVAGVFIAGDADGDVQFAIVAAAEGATAAVAINRELQEEDQLQPN
jgi:thioredoxin reductase